MPVPKGHPNYNIEGFGRPRKYDDEFIEQEAHALWDWISSTQCLYFKEFAFQRGYSPSKLSIFAERNENFRQALQDAHEWQESRLLKGGLTKEFDSAFTRFAMSQLCGWKDQKTLNVQSNGPIPPWIAEAEGKSKNLVKNDEPAS